MELQRQYELYEEICKKGGREHLNEQLQDDCESGDVFFDMYEIIRGIPFERLMMANLDFPFSINSAVIQLIDMRIEIEENFKKFIIHTDEIEDRVDLNRLDSCIMTMAIYACCDEFINTHKFQVDVCDCGDYYFIRFIE